VSTKEKDKLLQISRASLYSAGVMSVAISYCFRILQRHFHGDSILEMGPAEGIMTELLVATGKSVTLLEGSALFCTSLRQRFPQAQVVHALFEEFDPPEQFDTVILGHVLEHVQDPVDILLRVRRWLKAGGRVFAAVPNARSVHRQAAVIMGLLPHEDALNEMDLRHGHRRVFNPESFRAVFTQAGLRVDIFGGYWLKSMSNAQIESCWTTPMIEAFMQMGERYPDIAGEIYVLASEPLIV
jgi:2-polyprenyl-3-methyl-5-hydroxy-6-metoxy-1,4-benzoquinol methylase